MRTLSRRRAIATDDTYEPKMNEFLHTRIDLNPPKPAPEPEDDLASPRRARPRTADTGERRTTDDILASRRRAFEIRHERHARLIKKAAEKEWASSTQYRDWRSRQTMRKPGNRRPPKDRHVIEDVVHERNEYYLDAITTGNITPRRQMSHTRTLPPEMRAVAPATPRAFFWG